MECPWRCENYERHTSKIFATTASFVMGDDKVMMTTMQERGEHERSMSILKAMSS